MVTIVGFWTSFLVLIILLMQSLIREMVNIPHISFFTFHAMMFDLNGLVSPPPLFFSFSNSWGDFILLSDLIYSSLPMYFTCISIFLYQEL